MLTGGIILLFCEFNVQIDHLNIHHHQVELFPSGIIVALIGHHLKSVLGYVGDDYTLTAS